MTLKKNPGAPKKQVKATISECKAENPLKCKFHGPKQLNAELGKVIGSIPFTMKKRKDGYDIALEKYPPKGTPQKLHDLINQKKKIGYVVSGIYDDGKYHLYIKFDDGQFDSPEGEDEKQDADTLSSEEAPNTEVKIANEDNLGEEFDLSDFDEDMVELSDFEDDMVELASDDKGFTDEEIKKWISDEQIPMSLGDVKWFLETGTAEDGEDFTETQKDAIKNACAMSGTNPISKAVLKKLGADGEQGSKNYDGKDENISDKEWQQLAASVKKSPFASYTFWESIPDIVMGNILKTADWHDQFEDSEPLSDGNQVTYKNFLKFVSSSTGDDSKFTKAMMKAYKSHQNYDMDGLDEIVSEKGSGLEVAKMKSQWNSINTDNIEVLHQINNSPSSKSNDKFKDAIADATGTFVFAAQNKDISGMSGAIAKLKSTIDGWKNKVSAKKKLFDALTDDKPMVEEFKELMKPLEHDDGKFPPDLTQERLEYAIENGKKAGGHGGLGTTIVEIGGKKYVCKSGVGKAEKIIRNGYNADMAYRAGGIYAPDAKLYDFGDGKVYKLSEYIDGDRLIDVWKNSDENKKDEIRKELLKGFPLDALFSNYDVLGTSPEESQTVYIDGPNGKKIATNVAFDNIIIGKDGHAYRIDNDGSFNMTGTGGKKNCTNVSLTEPVEFEEWSDWNDRQWIDDFRTMRRNEKNQGIFDRYSTADIFISAGNINLDQVVSTLPEDIQQALKKPLFEMKQMTWRAVNIDLGGFKNNKFASMALDASYEASKRGLRDLCKKEISWDDSGFGMWKKSWSNYTPKPFPEKKPEPPENPKKFIEEKYNNSEYTGGMIGKVLLNAAKTINNHCGVKQVDENGNVLGNGTAMSNPDYIPNPSKIALFNKIDREKLEELAKTDENAGILLGVYDTIMYSKENGWKKPIGQVPSGIVIGSKLAEDFHGKEEQKILDNMRKAIEDYEKKLKKYETVTLPEWQKRCDKHTKAEEEKAMKSGGSAYHNFHDFANHLINEGINTDGIAHRISTNGISPIESSMSSQKGSSYDDDAVKWKIREMVGLGYSLADIKKMADSDKLYNGYYYTSTIESYCENDTSGFEKDMASQAMYCGLNMIKLENELSDQYDKESGVVFLNRNIGDTPSGLSKEDQAIYDSSTGQGWVSAHVDSAADCMQFESNSWGQPKKQVYAVPFSRVVCCANNQQASQTGAQNYGCHSEQEYVGNLWQLPCWVYHKNAGLTWKGAIDKAKTNSGMIGFLKSFSDRLKAFCTLN